MATKPIKIAIVANASQASREVKSFSGRLSGTLKQATRVAGVAMLAAGAGAVVVGKKLVEAGERAATSNARIENITSSMSLFGDQAKTVSDRLVTLAEKQALATGVDQNAIKETQAKLLTFKELAKSADDVGGNFDRATKAAVDMGAAGFGSAETNAVQLGKALNDPIKGITALNRSGVTFTETEKKKIAAMVDSGKVSQAQNEILKAVEKQVGGTAEATANGTDRMKVGWSQFQEYLGQKLLPVVDKVTSYFLDTMLPAIQTFAGEIGDKLAPYVDTAKEAFSTLQEKLQPVGDWLQKNPEFIQGAATALGIAAIAAGALAGAMALVAIASSPITLTVLAIAALGGAFALAYKKSSTFRAIVDKVRDALGNFAGWVKNTVIPAIGDLAGKVKDKLQPILSQLKDTFQKDIKPAVKQVIDKFKEWWPAIKKAAEIVGKLIAKGVELYAAFMGKVYPFLIRFAGFIISNVVPAVIGFVDAVVKIIKKIVDFGKKVVDAVKKVAEFVRGVKKKFGEAVDFVTGIPGKIVSALGDLGGLLYGAGKAVIQGLLDGIESMIGAVTSKLDKLTSLIPKHKGPLSKDKRLLRPAGKAIMRGLVDGLGEGSVGVTGFLDTLTKRIERFAKKRFKNEKRQRKFIKRTNSAIKDQVAALTRNGAAQDALAEQIDNARSVYEDAKQAALDYGAAIRGTIIASGNLLNLGKDERDNVTLMGLLEDLRGRVEEAGRFSRVITQLTNQGLNRAAIEEMLAAGPQAALATAHAIQMGGKSAINEVNRLQGALAATGERLGGQMSNRYHSAGVSAAAAVVTGLQGQAAQLRAEATAIAANIGETIKGSTSRRNIGGHVAVGLVRGLRNQHSYIRREAEAVGDILTNSIKRRLRIKSPSKVFEGIGKNVVQGLSIGLDNTYVKRSGTAIAASLEQGFGAPALSAFASTRAEQSNSLTVRLTSEQVSSLQRGREIQLDLDSYYAAGGRRTA